MTTLSTPYNESLLHWIWKEQQLKRSCLFTADQKPVRVYHPGYANKTDGPDFLNARIGIGRLTFHGDVEIHWSARDWHHHGHHTDANYNRVVLHVVCYDDPSFNALREDGSPIPTLALQPAMQESLQNFAEAYSKDAQRLPCARHLSEGTYDVLEEQIDDSHRLYFETKVDALLQFYDPTLPLSGAWCKLVTIGFFDALGIRHNRDPMRQLARELLGRGLTDQPASEIISTAHAVAGIDPEKTRTSYRWKRKGSRPNNHPRHRMAQGAELLKIIHSTPLIHWLRTEPAAAFQNCIDQMSYTPGLGTSRADVVYATVWLPALYILGDLTANRSYTAKTRQAWLTYRMAIPSAIASPFAKAGIPASLFSQKLGAVYQWKALCHPRHCERCKVFKNIINS